MNFSEKIETKVKDIKDGAKTWWTEHGDGLKALGAFGGALLASAGIGYLKGRAATRKDLHDYAEQVGFVIKPRPGYHMKEVPDEDLEINQQELGLE